jgi:phenylacetate-CoA ligase
MSGLLAGLHRRILKLGYSAAFARTRTYRLLEEYLINEWLGAERLAEIQRLGLKRLIEHAYSTVPYYRRLFEELGLRPADIDSTDDLQKLPLLEKRQLQEDLDDFISEAVPRSRLKYYDTSGSTGKPLVFAYDSEYWVRRTANLLRTEMMCGYEPGDRLVYVYACDYDSPEHRSMRERLKDRIVYNRIWIDAFRLTREKLERYARVIACFKPKMVIGFTSGLVLVARAAESLGMRYRSVGAVETLGELLTSEDRVLLEKVFGCRVFDRYGAEEVGVLAHECAEHTGLHVMQELNYIELVDREGSRVPTGEEGVVVVTNLGNLAMPLIRYKLEDVARFVGEVCPCGRSFPLLRMVGGRVGGFITTPSGKMAHGEYFTRIMTNLKNVLRFQVFQDSPAHILVRIVPSGPLELAEVKRKLQEIIRKDLDPALECEVEFCELSDLAAGSGKFRYVVSEVPGRF